MCIDLGLAEDEIGAVADPLMALVAEKRGGGGSSGNKYFQELKPSCQKPAGG